MKKTRAELPLPILKEGVRGRFPTDPAIPFLAKALDRAEAEPELKKCLTAYYGKSLSADIQEIRIREYQPASYCRIQYRVKVEGLDFQDSITLVGKVSARGLDTSGYSLFRSLWKAGLNTTHVISIPEPVGIVPGLQVWLHRTVPGQKLKDLLFEDFDPELPERVAGSLYQLQRIMIPSFGLHGPLDELHSIQRRILSLTKELPALALSLERLRRHCEQAVPMIPREKPRGIHRDFDLNHILVDGGHIYLIGFERYCRSDPAFDAGNFQSALLFEKMKSDRQQASILDSFAERFTEEFIRLSGPWTRTPVEVFTALRLVQRIYFAYQKEETAPFLADMIDIADARLRRLLKLRTSVA